VLAFSADGLARLVEGGLQATSICIALTKSVGFIRCLEAQVEDPLWHLVKRELQAHHVHLLAAGLGILSITTWHTGAAGKKVREALTHARCTGVVKIVTIAYLHVESNSPAQVDASNDSSVLDVCYVADIGSIITRFTAADERMVFIGALLVVALPTLAARCESVHLKTIARKMLVAVLKFVPTAYVAVSLWWGDVDASRAAHMLLPRIHTVCSQLLGLHIVWELAFAVLFGTPRLEHNTRFCKVNRPVGRLQHRAPMFILNAAVYNESLEIIERTIDDLTRLADAYSRHSGQAIIVIHDDLLGLLPDQDERVAQRVALYERKGVAFTVRGEGGRNGSFPKATNVNVGMGFFVELLGRGHVEPLGRSPNESNNVRNVFACMRDLRSRVDRLHAHEIFASFEAHIPEHVARQLASLDQDGIDSILTMQFDADTRIREDADPDCLHLFARDLELHPDIGLLQIMTLGHAMEPTFWSRYAVDWTNFLNGVAMPTGSSSGCPGPCVGHNIVIRLKDLIEVARGRGRDANYGGLEVWSELTSGEDFEMWLQLVARNKDSVYVMYAPIFEEHVTSDVHKEIGTLRKHMWSNLSLVFNSCDVRKRTGAVFTPELGKYLWPLHTSNSPWYAKIPTVGYLYVYITMASSLFKVTLSLVVHDSVLPTDALKPYFLAPHDGLVTVVLLYGVFGTLALQFIKRVHIAKALRDTDARAAIDMIVAPGLDGFIREVFGNGLISLLFWGGLHIDLLDVLGSYVRCKKVKFTPTHAAAAEIAGENFLSAATRVLSGYSHRMLALGGYLGVLVVLSMIGVLAPTKNMLAAVLLGLIPPARLLLLDPSVLLATSRTLKEALQQGQQQIEALKQQVAALEERLQANPNPNPNQVPAPAPVPAAAPQPGPENVPANLQRVRDVRERVAVWWAAQQWVARAEEAVRAEDVELAV